VSAEHTKILLPGGAGLVGQNLIIQLKRAGLGNIVVFDKHRANLAILKRLHPDVAAHYADLAEPGPWQRLFADGTAAVLLHAQIGHPESEPFERNNVTATARVLEAILHHRLPHVVHVSSSVVESSAEDHYTTTKRAQERLVLESGVPCVVLRPTLMFGWFDRKHLGWLARFMRKTPVFPIPGDGRYVRQPLYAADFCRIIVRCLETAPVSRTYNITGLDRIDYIDIIRAIRAATGARTALWRIPVGVFAGLLRTWAIVDRDPPFTADQLRALVVHEEFELIDWPAIFGVTATRFSAAIEETFCDPTYAGVVLDF
jgi:uncharacterized protein YbjT (DUF2867 family)